RRSKRRPLEREPQEGREYAAPKAWQITQFTDRLRAGTVPDVQRVYFWFSKPALGGLVCGNRVR
ncbi:hypothetical protein, partial [Nocardia beijingensis]|uniref:hypothetical protein n=1 Tax=Nocardia beijingensis TaxID=95162 RepID=UPI000AEF140B